MWLDNLKQNLFYTGQKIKQMEHKKFADLYGDGIIGMCTSSLGKVLWTATRFEGLLQFALE